MMVSEAEINSGIKTVAIFRVTFVATVKILKIFSGICSNSRFLANRKYRRIFFILCLKSMKNRGCNVRKIPAEDHLVVSAGAYLSRSSTRVVSHVSCDREKETLCPKFEKTMQEDDQVLSSL